MLQTIIDCLNEAVYICDQSGKVKYRNTKAEELYQIWISNSEAGDIEDVLFSIVHQTLKQKRDLMKTVRKEHKHFILQGNILNQTEDEPLVLIQVRDMSKISNLQRQLKRVEEERNKALGRIPQGNNITGSDQAFIYKSKEMQIIYRSIQQMIPGDFTVLITGESGVGKEVIAKVLHESYPGSDYPFIKINCGAIPDNLIESELFGYTKGAFTGANPSGKKGLVELADRGTLFLDEIGEISLQTQVKLLHFLQDFTFQPVGGYETKQVTLRVIAATNRNLEEEVRKKRFRQDLFYRLQVIPIHIPPLRHRQEDIEIIVHYYLDYFNKKYQVKKTFSKDSIEQFLQYTWPGNIRELMHIVERLIVSVPAYNITAEDLPDYMIKNHTLYSSDEAILVNRVIPLQEAYKECDVKMLKMLKRKKISTYEMARQLGVNQSTIVRKLQLYGDSD
jgi:transcriptional regulator with PAS, ATPase and Fis domain